MADRFDVTITTRAAGFFRGDELDAPASLDVRAGEIELTLPTGPVALRVGAIDGISWRGEALVFHLHDGDVIALADARAARDALDVIVHESCVLPELTLSLRGLGSRRVAPGDRDDAFFAPFLAARRRATRAGTTEERRVALDAAELRDAVADYVRDFALASHPQSEPDRRALEAQLREDVEPLFAELAELERTARALGEADDASHLLRWREWAGAVRRTFERADICWLAMRPALEAARRHRRPSRWRRWLRLGVALLALAPTASSALPPFIAGR